MLKGFKLATLVFFKDEADWNKYINTKTSAFGGKSPKEFLLYSRRPDRLNFAIITTKTLQEEVEIYF